MPIYEYHCRKCSKQFEVLVRNKSDLPAKCPECGAADPIKAFSAFAVSSSSRSDLPAACDECPGAGSSACSSGGCPMDSGF